MARAWEADPSALFERRLGKSPAALGNSSGKDDCPDIWRLDNGDIAVIGRDLTARYAPHLPDGVSLAPDERLVVIPGSTLHSAAADIADA
ncbi:hypothetical protein [Streptomyces sp. IB2014 016-6]|uniref:hypothetical protein n=1 Tax=Streptomyces sp. IB2014 016-6 TaxID=2517818 RepID=UPI0011C97AF8|nr:hypothetical protein [Streptomyces sp. IB2014 016-6]TXL90833.1 hypothetical protein EW053_07615 [Streptomyces sp. IB2014 016-6]